MHGPSFCGKDADNCCDSCSILHEKLSICFTVLHFIPMSWRFRSVRLAKIDKKKIMKLN